MEDGRPTQAEPKDDRAKPVPEGEHLPGFMIHAGDGVVLFARDRGDHVRYEFGDKMIELDGEFTADDLREIVRMMDVAEALRTPPQAVHTGGGCSDGSFRVVMREASPDEQEMIDQKLRAYCKPPSS